MALCSSCQADNPAGSRFCNQCGTALDGGSLAPASRQAYTPQHLIDKVLRHRAALEGERKQVTVFFADMAGSTRLSEAVDAEDWHRILDEFFAILGEEIHRYEGTINQYTGDGVMALFGAPVAHEDHAMRACHAALALQTRLRQFSDRLRMDMGLNLSVRMGMNSGEVVVGRIGDDLRMDYTAKGLTVNLAARMEQIAEPGRIYLTRYTAQLVEGYFQLRDLGEAQVKGASEPIPVHELIAATAASLRLEVARERGLTGFIGRREEMRQLEEAAAGLRQDGAKGQIMLVSGDGGLGKSRLCFEAMERWRDLGLRVYTASAVPYSQAVPLLPIQQLMRQRFGVLAEDSAEAARGKVAGALLMKDPGLRDSLPLVFEFLDIADPAGPASQVPPDARAQKIMALFRESCPTAASEPTVAVIEDLHWIDGASEEFLAALCESTRCAPLLLIFNSRPGPLPDWLAGYAPTQLQLQPLDAVAMAEMTHELLGDDPSVSLLAPRIAEMASGNPFFVEETVRALAADGELLGQPGSYRASRDTAEIEIPATVHSVIAGRIDRLDGASKALLQTAAVLGKTFPIQLLRYIAKLPDDEFDARIEDLKQGHYIRLERPQEPVHWGFCHPLFQEVSYGTLLSDRRKRVHAEVAQALEHYVAKLDDPGELHLHLAHHWYESGIALPAARWALAAGTWILSRDPREELRLFRQAVEVLTPLPDDPAAVPLAVSARAGIVRAASFYPVPQDEIERSFNEAREIAERHDHRLGLAELLISQGGRDLNLGRPDDAAQHTAEAMALAQEIGDPSLEARFRIPILFSNFASGRLREGLKILDQRDGGDWHRGPMREDNFLSRGFRALMLASRGQLADAEAEARAAVAFAEEKQRSVSWMYANLVDIEWLRGKSDQVMSLARTAVSQAEEYGSPLFNEVAYRAMAQARLITGDVSGARKLLMETLALVADDAVAFQFQSAHYWLLAVADSGVGDHASAARHYEQAIATAAAGNIRIWEVRARLSRASFLLALGEGAEADLARARELIEWMGADVFWPAWWRLDAAMDMRAGREGEAGPKIERAESLERSMGMRARALAVPLAESA